MTEHMRQRGTEHLHGLLHGIVHGSLHEAVRIITIHGGKFVGTVKELDGDIVVLAESTAGDDTIDLAHRIRIDQIEALSR